MCTQHVEIRVTAASSQHSLVNGKTEPRQRPVLTPLGKQVALTGT